MSGRINSLLLRELVNSNIQIGDVSIIVIKQGPLNKTKITENGKKYRKNWSVSNVVLTDMFLFFFKDSKSFLEKATSLTIVLI